MRVAHSTSCAAVSQVLQTEANNLERIASIEVDWCRANSANFGEDVFLGDSLKSLRKELEAVRQADVAEVEAVLEQETREGRPKLQLRAEWEQNEELIVFFFWICLYEKTQASIRVFFDIYVYIYYMHMYNMGR